MPAFFLIRFSQPQTVKTRSSKSGAVLHELLPVLAIVAALTSGIFWLFAEQDQQAENANVFQLTRLRSAIDTYHRLTGHYPRQLNDLTAFQPVLSGMHEPPALTLVAELPSNQLTSSTDVLIISNSPAILSDVTNRGGWLYNPETGEVWINHKSQYFE